MRRDYAFGTLNPPNSRTDCLSRAMVLDARSATLKQDLQWQEREKANSSQLTRTI